MPRQAHPNPAGTPSPVAHCMELLESGGPVCARRMFGGWGFYIDGLFAALMADDRLYLKANAQTRPQFVAAGSQPFVYDGHGKPLQMDYYTPPDEAMESPALMRPWALLAVHAAVAARAAAPRKTAAKSPRKLAAK